MKVARQEDNGGNGDKNNLSAQAQSLSVSARLYDGEDGEPSKQREVDAAGLKAQAHSNTLLTQEGLASEADGISSGDLSGVSGSAGGSDVFADRQTEVAGDVLLSGGEGVEEDVATDVMQGGVPNGAKEGDGVISLFERVAEGRSAFDQPRHAYEALQRRSDEQAQVQGALAICMVGLLDDPQNLMSDEELASNGGIDLELVSGMSFEQKVQLQSKLMHFEQNRNVAATVSAAEKIVPVDTIYQMCKFESEARSLDKTVRIANEVSYQQLSALGEEVVSEVIRASSDGEVFAPSLERGTLKTQSNETFAQIQRLLRRRDDLINKPFISHDARLNDLIDDLAYDTKTASNFNPDIDLLNIFMSDAEKEQTLNEVNANLINFIITFAKEREAISDIYVPNDSFGQQVISYIGEDLGGNWKRYLESFILNISVAVLTSGTGTAVKLAGQGAVGVYLAKKDFDEASVSGFLLGLSVQGIELTDHAMLEAALNDPEVMAVAEKIASEAEKIALIFSAIGGVVSVRGVFSDKVVNGVTGMLKSLVMDVASATGTDVLGAFKRMINIWHEDVSKRPPYEAQLFMLRALESLRDYPEFMAMYGVMKSYVDEVGVVQIAEQRAVQMKEAVQLWRTDDPMKRDFAIKTLKDNGVQRLYLSLEAANQYKVFEMGDSLDAAGVSGSYSVLKQEILGYAGAQFVELSVEEFGQIASNTNSQELLNHLTFSTREPTLAQALEVSAHVQRNFADVKEEQIKNLEELSRQYEKVDNGQRFVWGFLSEQDHAIPIKREDWSVFSLAYSVFSQAQSQKFDVHDDQSVNWLSSNSSDLFSIRATSEFKKALESQENGADILYKGGLLFFALLSDSPLSTKKTEVQIKEFGQGFERYLITGEFPNEEEKLMYDQAALMLQMFGDNAKRLGIQLSEQASLILKGLKQANHAVEDEIGRRSMKMFFSQDDLINAGKGVPDITAYRQLYLDSVNASALEEGRFYLNDFQWFDQHFGGSIGEKQKVNQVQRDAVRSQVEELFKNDPIRPVIEVLERGGLKLDIADVKLVLNRNGKSVLNAQERTGLENKGWASSEGGVSVGEVAFMFGFESSEAFLRALVDAPSKEDFFRKKTTDILLAQYSEVTPDNLTKVVLDSGLLDVKVQELGFWSDLSGSQQAYSYDALLKEADERWGARASLKEGKGNPELLMYYSDQERMKALDMLHIMRAVKSGDVFKDGVDVAMVRRSGRLSLGDLKPEYADLLNKEMLASVNGVDDLLKQVAAQGESFYKNSVLYLLEVRRCYISVEDEQAKKNRRVPRPIPLGDISGYMPLPPGTNGTSVNEVLNGLGAAFMQ